MEEKHLHRQAKEALEHFQLQGQLGEVRPWGTHFWWKGLAIIFCRE